MRIRGSAVRTGQGRYHAGRNDTAAKSNGRVSPRRHRTAPFVRVCGPDSSGTPEKLAPHEAAVGGLHPAHTDRLERAVEDVRPVALAVHPAVHDRAGVLLAAGDVLAAGRGVALRLGPGDEVPAVVADVAQVRERVLADLFGVQADGRTQLGVERDRPAAGLAPLDVDQPDDLVL